MNSTTINKGCKKNAYIIIYYLFLLGIFFTWHDFQNNPGIAPRLAYFSLVAGPLFFINKDWAVPIVTLFFILAKDNYTSSYLPTELYTYILLLLAIAIVRGRRNMLTETPLVVFLLFAITLICNLFFGTFENVTGMLLLLILALQSGGAKDAMTTKYLSYSFVVAGVVISVYQIQYGEMMAVESWMGTEQIERQGFKDINYTACVISLGVCAAMINIFVEKTLNNIWKLILVSSILLMVYSLFVNASRGSILAVAFPALVLLICSKTKLWLKIFSIVFVLLALYVAYVNGVMAYHVYTNTFYSQIMRLGSFNEGDDVKVTFLSDSDKWSYLNIRFATFDNDTFSGQIEKIDKTKVTTDVVHDGYAKFTINNIDDGNIVITTIPAEDGWQLYIDGAPAEYTAYQNALIAFDVPSGNHTAELLFTAPGLKEGAMVSCAGIVLLAAFILIDKNITKKKEKQN